MIVLTNKQRNVAWLIGILLIYLFSVGLVAFWLLHDSAVSLPSTDQTKSLGEKDSPIRAALDVIPPSPQLGDPVKVSLSGVSVLSPKTALTIPYKICLDNVRLVQIIGERNTGTTALGDSTQDHCYGLTASSGVSYPEYYVYTTPRFVDNTIQAPLEQQN